jgi:hypothetical protein
MRRSCQGQCPWRVSGAGLPVVLVRGSKHTSSDDSDGNPSPSRRRRGSCKWVHLFYPTSITRAPRSFTAMASLSYEDGAVSKVPLAFDEVAVLPEDGDNCAICRRVVPGGTVIRMGDVPPFTLNHTILEGHRFAVKSIAPGDKLLSWGLVFGEATAPIAPGQYLANARVLAALRARGLTDLPAAPNFDDLIVPHTIDDASFKPSPILPLLPGVETETFLGYSRPGGRGIGTRNFVIAIGVSSLAAGYVKALEAAVRQRGLLGRAAPVPAEGAAEAAAAASAAGAAPYVESAYPHIDGVVAVPHTEGGGQRSERPHNFELVCRTLSGFIVHPNVGAALICDYGSQVRA